MEGSMAVLPGLLLATFLLLLPAWIYARNRHRASPWSLFIVINSVANRTVLAAFGVGPQSRGNLVEVIYLALATVGGYYLKTFAIDPWLDRSRLSSLVLMGLTIAVALLLRLLMPALDS
jgi:hypothetical protein